MNKTVNKFLLVGAKFILEMHLRKSELTYGACGPFTKKRKNTKI